MGLGAIPGAPAAVGATKEFFVPVTYATAMTAFGDYPVANCDSSGKHAYIAFKVPHDFTSIITAKIIIIPIDTNPAVRYDISSNYGAEGEAYNTHSESQTAPTYNVTANRFFAIDISGILSSLAADDYVGVDFFRSLVTGNAYVLGVRFKYD